MSSAAMRLYAPVDCGKDGYPPEWHETIKHAVRDAAGHRCVRCQHPYAKGAGEWSRCDELCAHGGPFRCAGDVLDGPLESTGTAGLHVRNNHTPVEARWRILTVHHLTGDKYDCRWWNLAALCQRCHLQIQGRVDMRRVYPWPHSDWFKPYVAAYYAWAYLGEDISREEAEERMDELLGLELLLSEGRASQGGDS